MNYLSINGSFFNSSEPVFTHDNRAFKYGDGLFETIRAVNGKPSFIKKHFERLVAGMEMLKMNIPKNFTVQFLNKEICSLLDKNQLNAGARIRISVYRNSGGFYTPETNDVSCCIEAFELVTNLFDLNDKGLKIDIYDEYKKNTLNKFSHLKTVNSLPFVLAGLYKKEMGLDECIILNEQGNIAETISSNIFVVFNGVFYTPSLSQGCIPGVMRGKVIEIARTKNIEVQECPLSPNALLRADEVFITNSINGIRWIGSYKQKRYFRKIAEMLVDNLNMKMGLTEDAL